MSECPTLRIVDMEQTYYFFENKNGLWLADDMQFTNDPQKAWKLTDKFEANVWVIWNKRFDHLKLKLTEHEFISESPEKRRCVVCETETDNEVWCDIHTPLI